MVLDAFEKSVSIFKVQIFAGSLESANSSILAARRHFKEAVGKKNQDFIIMSLVTPSNLIGCGGDIRKSYPMRNQLGACRGCIGGM